MMTTAKLVIATKNIHKMKEFCRILAPLGIEAISQSEAGIHLDIEENAESFEGNSRCKAEAVYRVAGLPVIADDSGLEVEALNNAPGVYSARYGGPGLDDAGRTGLLLQNMEKIPAEKRAARFVCAITLIDQSGDIYSFTGVCPGKIGYAPKGENGFGYDPIFMVGMNSFSELSPAEKDEISHRGKAMKLLEEHLRLHNGKPVGQFQP